MDGEKKKKFYIHTFGCQMNFHDSEKIAGLLSEKGFSEAPDGEGADLVIFNTCSIREKADQKFLSELGRIRKLKRQKPGLRIAVAGCVAQQMGQELLKKAPYVDYIIGPQNLHALMGISPVRTTEDMPRLSIAENPELASMELPAARKKKPFAWVSIMYGCDNFCTYCIVPHTRGREVCRPWESIRREAEGLAAEGFKEITFLGQNVNSYRSGELDFPGLLEQADLIDGIERIRFVTSHPRDLSEGLIRAIGTLGKLCEHIHLPLQSGSDTILARMNRRYSFADYRDKIEKLRRQAPGIAITTDIIAGFPGETDNDHEATMDALKEIEYDGIFAFIYSPRPGTAASIFEGQVPDSIRKRRLNEILALQNDITARKNMSLVGTVQEVMIEGQSEKNAARLSGRTRTNKIVNFDPCPDSRKRIEKSAPGKVVNLKIIRAGLHSLDGRFFTEDGI
ncbi:MAG: tRNA (N6-isopentenyl adenosine(37)-C2)-methylthiotransferase MiaB [Nitrospiraceae bacterium]|nr:tRNA (N6-isopentenyl adenosine(37)-C2)-methylthiotransferase MiaB [Nitrospiraceae bacterium]